MSTRHKISAYGPGLSPTVAQTRYRLRVKLAGSARQERIRRRGAHSELFAPYIVYPLPPTSPEYVTREKPKLAWRASLPPRRREPFSILRPHFYIVYAQPTAVETTVRATLVSSPRQDRAAHPRLGPHHFVIYPPPPVAVVYAPVTIKFTRAPRYRKPTFRLQPPQVVTTVTPSQDVFGGVMVVLAPQRRGRPRPVPIYPIVVFVEQALGWTAIWLARTPQSRTTSFLTPPVVDAAVLPAFYGPVTKRVVSRRMVLYFLWPPAV